MVPRDSGFLRGSVPETMPAWLSEADVDFFTGEFKRSGFAAPSILSQHRPQRGADGARRRAGDGRRSRRRRSRHGGRFPGSDQLLANFKHFVPALRRIQMLPGCGHWTQQERPDEVNAAIIDFLHGLPS